MEKSDSTPAGHLNGSNPGETFCRGANAQNGHGAPDSKADHLAASFVKIADAHFVRKDYKASCASLQWALTMKPEDTEILAFLATVHFFSGDFSAACQAFRQALETDPKSARLHAQLAAACFKAGDGVGAKTALDQAFALDPHCPDALRLQAKLRAKPTSPAVTNLAPRLTGCSPLNGQNQSVTATPKGTNGANRNHGTNGHHGVQAADGRHDGVSINFSPRRLTIQSIVRESPALHRDREGKPIQMPVSEAVAEFIHERVKAGDRTVETGAGMSTLCFLVQGAQHTAIAPDPGLEQRLRTYCQEHGLGDERLTYISKTSQHAVWALEGEFDCALIDGGHGFPIPFIDFFYLNEHLKKGGYLIVDDLEIWTGEILAKFLSCEPAWKLVHQDGCRSIIFQKVGDARSKDWFQQEFVVRNSLHPIHLETVIPRETLSVPTA